MKRPEKGPSEIDALEVNGRIRIRPVKRGERRNMAREFRRRYPRSEQKGHSISRMMAYEPTEAEYEV